MECAFNRHITRENAIVANTNHMFYNMNRGKHEGENGISVYQYTASDQKIEELGFIPTQIQYDMMKNDIKKGAFFKW